MSLPIFKQKDMRAAICIKSELIPKSVTCSRRAIVQLAYFERSNVLGVMAVSWQWTCCDKKTSMQSIQKAQCTSTDEAGVIDIPNIDCALVRGETRLSA
jgi:hypothetical protein